MVWAVQAVVWRSGGPTAPVQIATMYPILESRPQLEPSDVELCSSTTELAVRGMSLAYNSSDVLPFLVATGGVIGYQTATVRPNINTTALTITYFSNEGMTLDLAGITDEHRGPLQLQVTLQAVISMPQYVAVVHAGSQDIFWNSTARSRFVTTTASIVEFNSTHVLTPADKVSLLWNRSSCENAAVAPYVSSGTAFKRNLTGADTIILPNGANGDLPLIEGDYTICVCDIEEGDTGCDDDNEYQMLGDKLKVIQYPRLMQPPESRIRAITRSSPNFRMYPTYLEGLRNGDIVFFTEASNCSSLPQEDLPNRTSLLKLHNTDDAGAATFQLPMGNPLTASSTSAKRTLIACFTTLQAGKLLEQLCCSTKRILTGQCCLHLHSPHTHCLFRW